MVETVINSGFQRINRGYNSVFRQDRLSLGIVVPIEHYPNGPVPSLQDHLQRVRLVDELGFKALWLRDIPLNIPSFGDAGQTFDPFTYLGFLAGQTREIALGISSIALPLHHPLHVAKAASSIDQLSEGRMILGVASGDRPLEYPAMGADFDQRGQRFREAFEYIRKAQEPFPVHDSHYGELVGHGDVLPKAKGSRLPMLLTGYSQQSLEWNARHADGWMSYPKAPGLQQETIAHWRQLVAEQGSHDKPFMQPLYVVLEEDDFKPKPIQLGFRIGFDYLIEYFQLMQEVGVNHIAINLRFNHQNMEKSLEKLAIKVLPYFHSETENES